MSETKSIDAVTKLVVDVATGIRAAAENGASFQLDLPYLLQILTDAPAAAGSVASLGEELKALDAAGLRQVKTDALAILTAATGGVVSSKVMTDIEEAVNILTSIYNIINAK